MIDAEFFIRDLEYRSAQLASERAENCLRLSLNLKALVQLRIQRTGTNSDGVPFSPYSPDYAKKREKEGYQTSIRDYTVTGAMWASITPTIVRQLEGTTIVVIKAATNENQVKLNAALVKPKENPSGNLLVPNQKESDFLAAEYFKSVEKYL